MVSNVLFLHLDAGYRGAFTYRKLIRIGSLLCTYVTRQKFKRTDPRRSGKSQ